MWSSKPSSDLHSGHILLLIPCREGWTALMAEQGFVSAQPAGNVTSRPRLLSRQTVVVGISDGIVRPQAAALVPRVRLQTTLPSPTDQLLASFR